MWWTRTASGWFRCGWVNRRLPFDVDRTEPIVGVELSADEGAQRVLSGDDAVQLARLGVRVEEHYGSTQDMEWLFEGVDVWPYPVIACQVTIGA